MGVLVPNAGHGAADGLIAEALHRAFSTGQGLAPITDDDPGFDLTRAYVVQAALTALRGGQVVGMKTGFTNRTIWDDYNVRAPIHGPILRSSWRPGPLSLTGLMEPKIEPEIVLRLQASPDPAMDDVALAACVGDLARGFELVHSPFPGWRFRAPDTVAAGALHGALVTGDFVPATPARLSALANLSVTLLCDGQPADTGHSANILGAGPLAALRDLVAQRGADRLPAGWIISTGTLTRALPAHPGQSWSTDLRGIDLPPLSLRLT